MDVLMQRVPGFYHDVVQMLWGKAQKFLAVGEVSSYQTTIRTLASAITAASHTVSVVKGVEEELVTSAKVVFATSVTVGRSNLRDILNSDVVVVDEAAQSTEAYTLIALRAARPKRVVLVGDTNQLPALVHSKEAEKAGYGRSLMERLYKLAPHDSNVSLLSCQYRMHPAISSLPNRLFYNSRLTDAPSTKRQKKQWHKAGKGTLGPCSFVHVDGCESKVGHSYANEREAGMLADIAQYLVRTFGVSQTDIGVITFYQAQARVLSHCMRQRRLDGVQVAVVDGFQGSEKGVILLSFVRSGKGVGFLHAFRRFNVAVTRAKHTLIMAGHAPTLSQAPSIGNCKSPLCLLVSDARARNHFYKEKDVRAAIGGVSSS